MSKLTWLPSRGNSLIGLSHFSRQGEAGEGGEDRIASATGGKNIVLRDLSREGEN